MTDTDPLRPGRPPPAADSCSVCYFSKLDANGIMACHFNSPQWQRANLALGASSIAAPPLINWPIVDPDDCCGHGYNTVNRKWMTPDGKQLSS